MCAPGLAFTSSRRRTESSATKTRGLAGSSARCLAFMASTFALRAKSMVGFTPPSVAATGRVSTRLKRWTASLPGSTLPTRTLSRQRTRRSSTCRKTVRSSTGTNRASRNAADWMASPCSSRTPTGTVSLLKLWLPGAGAELCMSSKLPGTGGSCRGSPVKTSLRPPKGSSGRSRISRTVVSSQSRNSAPTMENSSRTSTSRFRQRSALSHIFLKSSTVDGTPQPASL
mmetsp:Transcript_27250/g.80139  ORF Transcript_27250/g.80139 Transcript_27250/m.80139 type:complete len:228 (-) Transcript_27250:599-1282(-)